MKGNDLTPYIGIPFKYGGRDYKELDCYGLVMMLYKELQNINIPDVTCPYFLKDIADHMAIEKLKWTPCELTEGCVILFNINGYGAHVGYYLGNDKMIHTWEKTGGVTIERVSHIWERRILGCYTYDKR